MALLSIGLVAGCLAFAGKEIPPAGDGGRLGDAAAPRSDPYPVFDVRSFGAADDGVRLDTRVFQSAVDACHDAGGGTVLVPPGKYLVGTVAMRSHVTLHLASSARILGSTRLADYATGVPRCGFVTEVVIDKCLFIADNAENISISGRGTIDGQGAAFPGTTPDGKRGERPMLLRFYRCRGVNLEGVTFQDAASWCCHFRESADVRVRGVTIHNRVNGNNDGIDLMSTERVCISDCTLLCGDDASCFQDMSDERPVQDVMITNCLMSTRWAAIRSGGAHRGGIRRVTVSNCVIRDTYGCGIKLQISGNGSLEDMAFSNIVMTDVSSPISLRLGNHHYNNEARDPAYPFGRLRNILFQNIRARVIDEARLRKAVPDLNSGEERQCISICGIPGHPVEGVTLSNVDVTFPGGGTLEDASRRDLPELEDQYPEYFMWGVLPAYGLYARHARGLTLHEVRFELATSDARPAVVCDDVDDLEIAGLRAPTGANVESLLRLRSTRNAFIHQCRPLTSSGTFLRLEGASTSDITLSGNKLDRVRTAVTPADGAPDVNATVLPSQDRSSTVPK
jgi:polygalacturonase